MPGTVYQGKFRPASIGESAEGTLDYYVVGESDEATAHAAALVQCQADFPSGYRGMPLRSTSIEEVAPLAFKCPMKFGFQQNQAQPSVIPHPEDPGHADNIYYPVRGFSTIGGTRHVTTSLETTQTVAASGFTARDFKQSINVEYSADGGEATVRGVDLLAGAGDLTFTAQFPNAIVTNAYFRTVNELSDPCHTNDDTFYGYDAGELLFKGAVGKSKGMDIFEITFHFLFSKNVASFDVNDEITGLTKTGWQYVWSLFQLGSPTVDGRQTMRPKQTFVETVYPEGDFSQLLIGVG